MQYIVYILHSNKLNRFYIGYSANFELRLKFHKDKIDKTKYTAKADDWEVFLTIECKSKQQALAIEKHIKAMKSKKYIINLIQYPEMKQKLLVRFC